MNNIKYFNTIILVFASIICCLGQDVTLNTQAEVDAFDSGITVINGFLDIDGFSSSDPITNLDNLSNLNSITGQLFIRANSALTNLDGLLNLTSVGDDLEIGFNSSLTNLDGLFGLSTIGGNLKIFNNISLTNCCAIRNLLIATGSISGNIDIYNNPLECSSEAAILACTVSINVFGNSPCINSNNGSLQIAVSYFYETPFSYSWQNTTTGETGSGVSENEFFLIEDLAGGTYDITVSEPSQNPVIETGFPLLELPGSAFEIIEITTTNSANGFSNGSIEFIIGGGVPPYSYSWSGESSGTTNNSSTDINSISGLAQGLYDIVVTDDTGEQVMVSVILLDETIPETDCGPIDIVILNDVSGSVDDTEYAESQDFFVDLLNFVNIGPGTLDSRAAIIEWSSIDQQGIMIPMTGVISELQSYVGMTRLFNSGTDIQAGLTYGKNYLDTVARDGAEKVLILTTDAFNSQVPPSTVELADQYKAEGYHIITIAFDDAFADPDTKDLLQQISSIDEVVPGAESYSLLDQNIAENIVSLYLCAIEPGSSATAFFDRDGAIDIIDIQPVGSCPTPDVVEITFTLEALEDLSLPTGTPVTFYYNNPELFGATPIMTWTVPCSIPVGTSETFTVALPVYTAANIYAVLNDDGSQLPAISFPITDIEEFIYTNNIADTSICIGPIPTLQALKYTTTPSPVCNAAIYTVDVCNISSLDALGVTISDVAPVDFVLQSTSINDNGCTTDNGANFDIPAGCCISITYTYDVSSAANGFYNDQDVNLGGPSGQSYIGFNGLATTAEDVSVDGTLNCPSTIINFLKEVNTTSVCEDGFVAYTFTIDNQLDIPLQGIQFTDILPSPANWTFEPYGLNGLSISNPSISEGTTSFIIDEVDANTVATFSMDASLGDWVTDGNLNNTATLSNVPDLDNGGFQMLTSNTTATTVFPIPEIMLPDTIYVESSEATVDLEAVINTITSVTWTGLGDGSFSNSNASTTTYSFGTNDYINEEVLLNVMSTSDCGDDEQDILVILIPPCVITVDNLIIGNCNDNGTDVDPIDDTYTVTINASAFNPGISGTYSINDGTNTFGPFSYGTDENVILPADGNTYDLTLTDIDDATCSTITQVSQTSCSNTCLLSIDNITIGNCNDSGTNTDPSDDTYEVSINASALNAGISGTYSINDGTNDYGPFPYGTNETITLPADGNIYNLTFTDNDDATCLATSQVSQTSCSNTCALTFVEALAGACNPNGTVSDPSDDTYEVSINASAVNPGISNQFTISEGTNILGTFTYDTGGIISLPADGNIYTLTFTDINDSSCFMETQVSQNSCSNTCELMINDIVVMDCDDNGTDTDSEDDIFNVDIIVNALNPGASGTYQISDGTNIYGPFVYGILETVTLSADGTIQNLIFSDTDDAACSINAEVSQSPCSCLSNVFFHLEQPLCEGDLTGAIIIDSLIGGIGPFNYSFDNENFYSLDSIGGGLLDSIPNLFIGDYDFYVNDEGSPDCIYTFPFSIEDPFPLDIYIGEDTTINLGNSVPIFISSNIPYGQLDWEWNDSSSLTCTNCINPIANPLESTTYILEVMNADGCISSDTLNIKVLENYDIYIPNAFSPNDDGANDFFQVYPGLSIAEITNIEVFSRWGELVYQQAAYNPHDLSFFNVGWDGRFNGEKMNQGVFVYLVKLRLVNGEEVLLTGDVTLVR